MSEETEAADKAAHDASASAAEANKAAADAHTKAAEQADSESNV